MDNKTNKLLLVTILIILIDLCYIFCIPLLLFFFHNDQLLLFFNNFNKPKISLIDSMKPLYMLPPMERVRTNLGTFIDISSDNNSITAPTANKIRIGNSGNIIHLTEPTSTNNVNTTQATTSKNVDNQLITNDDKDSTVKPSNGNNLTNNYFTINFVNISN